MPFLFKAVNGTIDFGTEYNRARFKEFLKKNNGKEFRIDLIKRVRSLNQNRLYWFYLEVIEKETGNNANDLHEYFRRSLLPPKRLKVMNKEFNVPSSTTELSKSAMGDYMEKICALTNVPLPDVETYKKYIDSAPSDILK